ncbi:signal recognition particle-docking protein FtsY [Candidatus Neptunochlamydia vexilliferae]|uniref:signal recognition particle-docking protein FtsY n=1 Tax=Candidatus Neptunichlamydia vexilliferae TaxID=1651774 RepID=UPI001E54FBD9|nr:signal recognition particle-docking protein FtsY [Candidatus Neptunochlamydia vexilliferae]
MFSLLKSGLNKIRKAFSRTRSLLGDKVRAVLRKPLDEETLDELEQVLFEADLGSTLALEFVEHVRRSDNPIKTMQNHAKEILHKPPHVQGKEAKEGPKVILIVGVNGSGKTTSCAKLARLYKEEGKKVMLAAGDTFRAAAIEQLGTWADKLKLDCIKGKSGGDPSATIFDAVTAAKARGHDVVIADTAGRLQSKTDLMNELSKIKRTVEKVVPDGPHEIYLVLDATTGQNALDQAKIFNEFTPLTGLILTKLDGSAKGGIILSIYHQMGIPIRFIGIGEKEDDFLPFSPEPYVDALFS